MKRRDFLNNTKAGLFVAMTMPFLVKEIITDTPVYLKSISTDEPKELQEVTFSNDGKTMMVAQDSEIHYYELPTPWNLSTRTFKFRKVF